MPQFILDHGSPEAARQFNGLDYFTRGYIKAMFFTDASDPDDGDLQDATFAELAPSALADIIADCAAFQAVNRAALDEAMRSPSYDHTDDGYGLQAAGHDFWLTRNRHGAGFWDRGLGAVGDKLADAARAWSSQYVYRGDDGLVYVA
jgi:hypothetical protein